MHASTTARARPQSLPAIENVLFATDFSHCSQLALPFACAIAEQHHATLHIVHILGPSPLVGPLGTPYADTAAEEREVKQKLEWMANTPAVKKVRHEWSLHRGATHNVICRTADKWNIDLIVMGTHGRKGVRQLVMGSVAEHVFRQSACPVVTVGPGAGPAPKDGKFRTILLAVDLSPSSLEVLDFAHLFAAASEAKLILFHAVEENPELILADPSYLDTAVATGLKTLRDYAPGDLSHTESIVKIGPAAECIVRTATEQNADLIVIGTRRGSTVAAHNPWSTAHEVVCGAPCPVLTVRH